MVVLLTQEEDLKFEMEALADDMGDVLSRLAPDAYDNLTMFSEEVSNLAKLFFLLGRNKLERFYPKKFIRGGPVGPKSGHKLKVPLTPGLKSLPETNTLAYLCPIFAFVLTEKQNKLERFVGKSFCGYSLA